jgi:putative PIN family toxin of toxin-antitoxin system
MWRRRSPPSGPTAPVNVLRVTADTNIFVSGLNFAGTPGQIPNLAESGAIRLAVSDVILDEVTCVLRREKFGWPQAEIDRALTQISRFAEHVEPTQRVDAITEDPTDDRILECAVASRSEYLVTGDHHLLKLGQFGGTKIVKPADFLEIQAQAGRGR